MATRKNTLYNEIDSLRARLHESAARNERLIREFSGRDTRVEALEAYIETLHGEIARLTCLLPTVGDCDRVILKTA